jgi:hypothetical protein
MQVFQVLRVKFNFKLFRMQVFQVLRVKFNFKLIHYRHQRRARAGVQPLQRATSAYLRLGLRALSPHRR